MPSLKELNARIGSLKNTQKMTRTMKLVAASKMRRAQQAQGNAHDYAERLRALLDDLAESTADMAHPLFEQRERIERVLVLLVVSDRGLCGGFNNNLCRHLSRWLRDNRDQFGQVHLSFCGRRGYTFFRRLAGVAIKDIHEGVTEKPVYETAARIAQAMMDAFTSGAYDRIYVAYNRFQSALTQVPTLEQVLPIEPGTADDASPDRDFIYEPEQALLLARLLPSAIKFRIYNVLLENAAGEHAARMTAMDSATNNAGDMIDRYTLLRNRERQAAITRELIEIVTGAESL